MAKVKLTIETDEPVNVKVSRTEESNWSKLLKDVKESKEDEQDEDQS